jgi:hypothetical protein
MSNAFRSLDSAVERRLEHARDLADLDDPAPAVRAYARRVARCVAGGVGFAGGLAMFVATIPRLVRGSFWSTPHGDGLFSAILIVSVLASFIVYAIARRAAERQGAHLAKAPPLTGNATLDLVALETKTHLRALERRVLGLETASAALPLMAWALLAPLALHLVVGWLLFGIFGSGLGLRDFDQWIGASTVIVGVPHLVLALCCFLYARKLRRHDIAGIESLGRGEWGRALGFTTLVSIFPGIFLLFIPTVLVAVTGLAFIPATFGWIRGSVLQERRALELVLG